MKEELSQNITSGNITVELSDNTIKKLIEGITQAIFEKKTLPEPYVNVKQLSILLDISRGMIYRLTCEAKYNKFPCHYRGRKLSFRVSEVEQWLEKNKGKIKYKRDKK